jgi:hypothetical protein
MKMISVILSILLMLSACSSPLSEKWVEPSKVLVKEYIPPIYCDSIVYRDFHFKIEHENYKEKELKGFVFMISTNGVIYKGDFKNDIFVSNLPLCFEEWYPIRFDLIDKQLDKHYWWSNLESYPLAKYNEIDITLLSRRKHLSEEEIISFEIKLK